MAGPWDDEAAETCLSGPGAGRLGGELRRPDRRGREGGFCGEQCPADRAGGLQKEDAGGSPPQAPTLPREADFLGCSDGLRGATEDFFEEKIRTFHPIFEEGPDVFRNKKILEESFVPSSPFSVLAFFSKALPLCFPFSSSTRQLAGKEILQRVRDRAQHPPWRKARSCPLC